MGAMNNEAMHAYDSNQLVKYSDLTPDIIVYNKLIVHLYVYKSIVSKLYPDEYFGLANLTVRGMNDSVASMSPDILYCQAGNTATATSQIEYRYSVSGGNYYDFYIDFTPTEVFDSFTYMADLDMIKRDCIYMGSSGNHISFYSSSGLQMASDITIFINHD